uniref:Uncharacterized protein n=1 Tax=Setaria viridis TaxID=4556 RepID=A0A4U6V9E4_SETVI|nr:hypothetical protein SEVIR_4G091800v2 [Setaria viridis]
MGAALRAPRNGSPPSAAPGRAPRPPYAPPLRSDETAPAAPRHAKRGPGRAAAAATAMPMSGSTTSWFVMAGRPPMARPRTHTDTRRTRTCAVAPAARCQGLTTTTTSPLVWPVGCFAGGQAVFLGAMRAREQRGVRYL